MLLTAAVERSANAGELADDRRPGNDPDRLALAMPPEQHRRQHDPLAVAVIVHPGTDVEHRDWRLYGLTITPNEGGPAWGAPSVSARAGLPAVVVVVLVGGLEVALECPVGDVGAEGFAGEDGGPEVQAGPDARVDELLV